MLALNRDAATAVTADSGSTPLHLALEHGANPAVACTLLAACPAAASMRDKLGRTPLALALAQVRQVE